MAPDAEPTIGDLLRRHRVLGGLSQEELAERAAFITAAGEPASRPSPLASGARERAGAGASTSMLPVRGFLGAVAEHALVGRGTEVAAMLAPAEATRQGAGRLLALAGEPGAGKTCLAQEIVHLCRDRRFLVATGHCYEPHQAVPLAAARQASALGTPLKSNAPVAATHKQEGHVR